MAQTLNGVTKAIKGMYIAYSRGTLQWKTKEGYQMLVKNMETSHVENTYKYMARKPYRYKTPITSAWQHIFKEELRMRKRKPVVIVRPKSLR